MCDDLCVCICVCEGGSVCVCVRERERVCARVFMHVCVFERECL